MEDSTIDSGFDAPAESKIPMYLGIAGVILGGVALVVAVIANGQATALTEKQLANEKEIYDGVQQALADARANGGDSRAFEALSADFESFKSSVAANFENVNIQYAKLAEIVAGSGKRRNSPPSSGTAVSSSQDGASASTKEYVVKSGDNFWKIAQANGCSVKEIQELNPNVDAAKIRVGQKLVVPAK